jgi:hypothetical protein
MAPRTLRMPRGCSTICLPRSTDLYQRIIDSPHRFRQALDPLSRDHPELFPTAFASGYTLKDSRTSAQPGLRLRRLTGKADGSAFTVRPAFARPYRTGWAEDVAHALFWRRFGVPYWARAHALGRSPRYWYRLEAGLGRNRLVGTTVRQGDLPAELLADEHHQDRAGRKNYLATTVGDGCCLGAALAATAGAPDLQAAYGVFVQEALNLQAEYRPRTVNTDGWAATQQAWRALFPLVVIRRCFWHGWLSIRERAKHLGELFARLAEKVGDA